MNEEQYFNRFEQNVIAWGKSKGLISKENSFKQFTKTTEELGEIASALFRDDMELLEDSIGDVFVTLIILAEQNGLSVKTCCDRAWNEIKDRQGKTINGKFIKQEDLK